MFEWENRKRILTKKELEHLIKDANCKTKDQFQNNINKHEEWRKEFPESEPCWICKTIAKKLNMFPKI